MHDEWLRCVTLEPRVDLRWLTQVPVQGGVLDLLLSLGGCPVLIVENKVDAPIRSKSAGPEHPAPGLGTAPNDNQLRIYGRWLKLQCDGYLWSGMLVLLTHFSNAPEDFSEIDAYSVPTSVCRWRAVWSWIRNTFHCLRHTYASHTIMNGAPLMVVARNLGHTDTRMVEKHYGHLAKSYVADAIRAAAPRFGIAADATVVAL